MALFWRRFRVAFSLRNSRRGRLGHGRRYAGLIDQPGLRARPVEVQRGQLADDQRACCSRRSLPAHLLCTLEAAQNRPSFWFHYDVLRHERDYCLHLSDMSAVSEFAS
jgi:hypothetical protein